MNKVISKDGTSIAYDKIGNGPALILVDGALCYRASGPNAPLSAQLAQNFTVFTYDRRGRGESDEMRPYSIEQEAMISQLLSMKLADQCSCTVFLLAPRSH